MYKISQLIDKIDTKQHILPYILEYSTLNLQNILDKFYNKNNRIYLQNIINTSVNYWIVNDDPVWGCQIECVGFDEDSETSLWIDFYIEIKIPIKYIEINDGKLIKEALIKNLEDFTKLYNEKKK
jgi:hypothetical protein